MTNSVLLSVLLSLLAVLVAMEGHNLLRLREATMKKRRRWMRIKVPSDKAITCRIVEPIKDAGIKEFLVDDITMAGISFYCDRKLEKQIMKMSIKFPFTTFKEAATVWGKVVYCGRTGTEERYRTGISYIKKLPS